MATLGLRITDGTTTVTVSNGTTGWLTSYKQGAEDASEEFSTDKARVILLSSLSTIQATVASLNKLFRQADNYQKYGIGNRVFMERDLGDAVWWRSEITKALPALVDQSLSFGLATGKMEMELVVTRKNFWEGTEAQIPLTNANGTNNTSGLTVYAIDDSQTGKDNWVNMLAAQVEGDLPAPIKVEFKNSYNDSDQVSRLYMAHNWRGTPSSLQAIWEGESYSGGSGSQSALPASPSYTSYSNGKYLSWTAGATETWLYWSLSAAQMGYMAGNFFRVFVRMAGTIPSDLWAKVQVLGGAGIGLFSESDYVLLNTSDTLQELSIVRLPPIWPMGSETLDDLRLQVVFKRPSGNNTIGVDYVELMPLDSYRKIEIVGYPLPYNYTLVDNQYDGKLYDYYSVSSDQALAHHMAYGQPIMLEPGVNQRIYLVGFGLDLPVRTATVKIWYRPRRLTL